MAKRVLILAPHTDDGEFGCGGTIARFVEEGADLHYVAFSGCRESLPEGTPPDALIKELQEAMGILGVAPDRFRALDYQVRRFPQRRQDILEDMVRMKKEVRPDLVLLPSLNDTHQDHQQVAQEGFRAFKTTCMLGYEMPWNNLQFRAAAFVVLQERHVAKKVEAMQCYRSQRERHYADQDLIRGLARTRGSQLGVPYAETFELFRWVL